MSDDENATLTELLDKAREHVANAPHAHTDPRGHYESLGAATFYIERAAEILERAKGKKK